VISVGAAVIDRGDPVGVGDLVEAIGAALTVGSRVATTGDLVGDVVEHDPNVEASVPSNSPPLATDTPLEVTS